MNYENIIKFIEFCKVRISGTNVDEVIDVVDNKQLIVKTEDLQPLMQNSSRAAFHQILRFLTDIGVFTRTMKGYYVINPTHNLLTAKDELTFAREFKVQYKYFMSQFKKDTKEEIKEDENDVESDMQEM